MHTCWRKLQALWHQRLFRLLLLISIILALFSRLDVVKLHLILAQFNLLIGLGMLVVNSLVMLLFALRWRSIAGLFGLVAPLRQFVRMIWLSASLSEWGPPLVVGELTRFHLMRSLLHESPPLCPPQPWAEACEESRFDHNWRVLASQLADRLSGYSVLFSAVMLFSPLYAAWFNRPSTSNAALCFGLLLIIGIIAAVLIPGWAKLRQVQAQNRQISAAMLAVIRAPAHYLYSLLIQTLLSVNLLLATVGLGIAQQPRNILLLAPLLLLGVSALPSVWSDWGKREATAIFLLAYAGLSPEQALAVSLLFGFCHLLTTLPGWLFLLKRT